MGGKRLFYKYEFSFFRFSYNDINYALPKLFFLKKNNAGLSQDFLYDEHSLKQLEFPHPLIFSDESDCL